MRNCLSCGADECCYRETVLSTIIRASETLKQTPDFVHVKVYCELWKKSLKPPKPLKPEKVKQPPKPPKVMPSYEDATMRRMQVFERANQEMENQWKDFLESSFAYDFREIHVHDYWF